MCADYERQHRSSLPTAPLTIFYSGTVNVYDDVPADTAHAIMLLAGSGKSCRSSPHVNAISSMAVEPLSVASTVSNLALSAETSTPATGKLGVPFSTLIVSSAPAPAASSFPAGTAKRQVVQRSDAELPYARKASLVRFLDRRRCHRIQTKDIANPVRNMYGNDEMGSAADEERARSKRHCPSTRPPSPSLPAHPDKS